jgi:hypothetical protein
MFQDQRKVLVTNELKILEGKSKINIFILSGILLLTFIGLGHSLGGLKYLKKRMDNPFTKWVNLSINSSEYAQSDLLQKQFIDKGLRDSLLIDTIRGYKRDAYRLVFQDGINTQFKRSRTIEPEEPLMTEILKKDNIIISNIKENLIDQYGQCWIIIKKEALNDLGFDNNYDKINYLELRLTYEKNRQFSFFIPVVAIVHDLPDYADIIISEHFDALLDSKYEEYQYVDIGTTNIISFLAKSEIKKESINAKLKSDSIQANDITLESFNLNGTEYQKHTVYLTKPVPLNMKFSIIEALTNSFKLRQFHEYECNIGDNLFVQNAQYLAINFYDLKYVRKFRDRVKKEHGFDISLNQVEDKENFALVTRLTLLLAFTLFLVSLTGVMIFIINLLISHFEKIQQNLGTFKAFGLSNDRLIKDYSYITMLFFSKALVWAIIGCLIYWGIAWLIGGKFTLLHWTFALSIIIIFGLVYLFILRFIKFKLQKTPGDLIYSR